MRAIQFMSEDEECEITRIAFDIDDTLTRDGRVEQEAFDALWALFRADFRLIAVTGRPLGWCDVIARQWPVHAVVGENGGGWIWRNANGSLSEGYFESESTRAEHQRIFAEIIADVSASLPGVRLTSDHRHRRTDLAFDINENEHLSDEVIAKLVARIEAHGAEAVLSSVHAHAQLSSCDKAKGIVHAAADALHENVGANKASWIFVGDSTNDAAAFSYFPITAGVANVIDFLPKLPTPPRYVANHDRGRGFAEIANTLLQRRA